jgi:hypothetical protein
LEVGRVSLGVTRYDERMHYSCLKPCAEMEKFFLVMEKFCIMMKKKKPLISKELVE